MSTNCPEATSIVLVVVLVLVLEIEKKQNGVEDEDEIWHKLNPVPANLIENQKVSFSIKLAPPRRGPAAGLKPEPITKT